MPTLLSPVTRALSVSLSVAAFSAADTAGAAEGCAEYAATAVTQSKDYSELGCKNGMGEWWNADPAYHSKWCELSTVTDVVKDAGSSSRAEALLECKKAKTVRDDFADAPEADPYVTEGGPVKVVDTGVIGLECRLKFGDFEFTADQVEGGIHGPAAGSNGMSAICQYHHPKGSMRISSDWAMPFPEDRPPAISVQVGCWKEWDGTQERVFDNGFQTTSKEFYAMASSSGSGILAVIARGPAQHFAREMLIKAHLHAPKSCP